MQYMESHSAALADIKTEMHNFDQRLRRVEHAGFQAVHGADSGLPVADEPVKRKPEIDDHRTAPHKLILLWPSVRPLLQEADVLVSDSYVMEAEDRGILKLYTRGEGIDQHDGTQPGGPASPARSEESGEGTQGSASTPEESEWGTGFPQTPMSDTRRSEPYCAGGLKPDGSLDLDPGTINALYESYIKNIHIMHPFLDKQRLRKLFDSFIRKYSTGHPSLRQKFAVGNGSDTERPLKRQRSNGSTATGMTGQDSNYIRRELIERSPGNAIVWLVLALGKICLHKEPLKALASDGRPNANTVISHELTGNPGLTGSSPFSVAIKPSPRSPNSTSMAHPTPPSIDGIMRIESRSRRNSMDGPQTSGARNLDVTPGLAYYAKAAEILGDQGDGNDLVHAQMFLLAGLYKGQLARVKESMSWIIMAGRASMMLLDRYKLYNHNYWTAYGDIRKQHEQGQARIKDKRHNLIVLASWTCLQLESDILAELRLPSSGIQTIENMLLMPRGMGDNEMENYEGFEADSSRESSDRILLFYSAQAYLRRRLNQVHKEMYGDTCLNQTLTQVREMLSGHESILGDWRDTLPPNLQWHDNDRPAADILEARLRAKYWGARYVINRPFLDYALHIMPHARDGRSIESVATDVHGNPRDKAEIHLFKAIELMGEEEVWQASKRCIEAAMQSTIALDGVPDRLIVTNIHGTAHA